MPQWPRSVALELRIGYWVDKSRICALALCSVTLTGIYCTYQPGALAAAWQEEEDAGPHLGKRRTLMTVRRRLLLACAHSRPCVHACYRSHGCSSHWWIWTWLRSLRRRRRRVVCCTTSLVSCATTASAWTLDTTPRTAKTTNTVRRVCEVW